MSDAPKVSKAPKGSTVPKLSKVPKVSDVSKDSTGPIASLVPQPPSTVLLKGLIIVGLLVGLSANGWGDICTYTC